MTMIKTQIARLNVEQSQIWINLMSRSFQVQEEASEKLLEYVQKHPDETDDIFEEFRLQLETSGKEQKFGIFIALNRILHISRETQIVHYVNQLIPVLLLQLKTNNPELVEKGAECLGNLAEAGGSITAEVIDNTLSQAIEWLKEDTNPRSTDIKKYSAVLILREFCCKQKVITFNLLFGQEQNFVYVFQAFRDNREKVRTVAAEVIKECISQIQERQQRRGQIKQTDLIYNQVEQAFSSNDTNFQHSALIVLGALISQPATANEIIVEQQKGEHIVNKVMQLLSTTKSAYVRKKCIDLIPSMYMNIKSVFQRGDTLKVAIEAIIAYIRKNANSEDRGQGFKSIGTMALYCDTEVFLKYADGVLKLIETEIEPPTQNRNGTITPVANLESLTALKLLMRKYAAYFLERNKINMFQMINDIFYSGFNRQVIECVAEICLICNGRFKYAAQVKLLNTCYIILQRQRDNFPLSIEEHFNSGDLQSFDARAGLNSRETISATRDKRSGAGNGQTKQIETSDPNYQHAAGGDYENSRGGVNANEGSRPSEVVGSTSRQRGKQQIKQFFEHVLDQNNQRFLYALVKQSCIYQQRGDEKGKEAAMMQGGANERTQMVTLALRTLQMFDLNDLAMSTVYFIETSVLNFLDDENPTVRKEAMRTCCGVILPKSNNLRISWSMERIINKLLHKFFVTATTDNEDSIRVTMLKYLNSQFDPFISKYENLLMLFNCMQDQNFEIRERTVKILGRLVPHNASQILPYLRQLIVALISQIEQSNDHREREEAVRLINVFVKSASEIARAYSTSILSCLIQKLKGERATSTFVSATLNVISEIAKVNSGAIKPYLGQLFPLCLMCIKDQSSSIKRQMAIHTLISIIVNTGFVVKPYFYYPELLTIITNLVQTEQNMKIRKLILKLIGTLGAVDPYLIKQVIRQRDDEEAPEQLYLLPQILEQDENDAGMQVEGNLNHLPQNNQQAPQNDANAAPTDPFGEVLGVNQHAGETQVSVGGQKQKSRIGKSSVVVKASSKLLVHYDELNLAKDKKYPAMAIHHMLKVLVERNLRDHHKVCLNGIIYIVKNQPDCLPFMKMLIPPLMELMRQNDPVLSENLFMCIKMIIQSIPKAMFEFAEPIFQMIHQVIYTQPIQVIDLLREINSRYKASLFSHLYLVLPEMLQLIERSRKRVETLLMNQQNVSMDLVQISQKAILFLPMFDTQILDDHLYLIVNLMLRTAQTGLMKEQFEKMNQFAIRTLKELVRCSTFREHLAQVVHQLLRLLDIHSQNVKDAWLVEEILRAFSVIALELKADFAPYISLIQKAIRRNKLEQKCAQFDVTIKQITKNDSIEQFIANLDRIETEQEQNSRQNMNEHFDSEITRQDLRFERRMETHLLIQEFDTSKCHISDDWRRWLIKTSYALLKYNPSHVLFACSTLTEVYAPLATDLYCIAFVSCWREMSEGEKKAIMESLKLAIESPSKTSQVLQQILNLAEFMELDENEDIKLFSANRLAKIAEECKAYAKALYYWEQEFENNPKDTVELLIHTNNELQQPEAAEGIHEYAKKNMLIREKEDWYEKLQKWPEALGFYEQKTITRDNYVQVQKGKLKCYKNLMDWRELSKLVEQMWETHLREKNTDQKQNIKNEVRLAAPDAVYAAWNLNNWSDLKTYARNLDTKIHSYEKNFYSAVYLIKIEDYHNAVDKIDKARETLNSKITSLLSESYNRAYATIQELQFLKELEEVIEYKTTSSVEKKANLYSCWRQRQKSVPPTDLEVHQKLLNIRCLVVNKQDEIDSFINFAKMAQDTGNSRLSTKILLQLKKELYQSQDKLLREERNMGGKGGIYHSVKEKQKELINNLTKVEIAISDALYNQSSIDGESFHKAKQLLLDLLKQPDDIEPHLLSICHQKLGFWQFEYKESTKHRVDGVKFGDEDYADIVGHCKQAVEINPKNAEAWHIFSTTSDEARIYASKQFSQTFVDSNVHKILYQSGAKRSKTKQEYLLHRDFGHNFLPSLFDKRGSTLQNLVTKSTDPRIKKVVLLARKYVGHVVNALTGLVQQLSLSSQHNVDSNTKTLQTTLRLLKIWFQHGNLPEIEIKLRQGVEQIDLKVWIEVIPQLLARIDIQDNIIRQALISLFEKISLKFPQALIYSLSVTQKSSNTGRREAAEGLIEKLKQTQSTLIEQATIISNELNRSAILLSEIWVEAIEEASRIYFSRNDGQAMYSYIKPFHDIMEKQPETMNEISFYQGHASDLLDAWQWMERYKTTDSISDISMAWDIYYMVHKKISSKQKEVQFYELRNVAPKLLNSANLQIAVPGTFQCNRPVVKISKFASVLPVLESKQHPRKMQMYGSDGREYVFLLKGHEDIRQDERVMQLFGLVNTLLSIDPQTAKKDLSIRRYPVIPLSQNTGLIGWVNNCDTLHMLIKEHRWANKIPPKIDWQLMDSFCSHFETCPLPNKVEIFRHALDKTLGEDLKVVLWVKSQNSEVWLERRTNYTRSLAVMSMVGYILGLGDRHPSNIMLERYTGKIVHIDFGDCFEVAMRREKFPERIPFRLTRMLVRAMEVSGIEGNYRKTCENTIRVMRESKESILAIMEAFVYDPLISFRLLNPQMFKKNKGEENEAAKENNAASTTNNAAAENEQKTQEINLRSGEKQSLVKSGGNRATNRVSQSLKTGGALAQVGASNNIEAIVQDSFDIVAQIEKTKMAQIREKIVDNVLERMQRVGGGGASVADKNLAESKFSRHAEDMELRMLLETEQDLEARQNELNQIAEIVIQRIQDKLRGLEFASLKKKVETGDEAQKIIKATNANYGVQGGQQQKSYEQQVDILIKQATSHENLASCYVGWCPYW